MTRGLPLLLLTAYLCLFILLAIKPYDRDFWLAENLPIVLIVAALVVSRPWFAFSNTAYLMMAFLIFLHLRMALCSLRRSHCWFSRARITGRCLGCAEGHAGRWSGVSGRHRPFFQPPLAFYRPDDVPGAISPPGIENRASLLPRRARFKRRLALRINFEFANP